MKCVKEITFPLFDFLLWNPLKKVCAFQSPCVSPQPGLGTRSWQGSWGGRLRPSILGMLGTSGRVWALWVHLLQSPGICSGGAREPVISLQVPRGATGLKTDWNLLNTGLPNFSFLSSICNYIEAPFLSPSSSMSSSSSGKACSWDIDWKFEIPLPQRSSILHGDYIFYVLKHHGFMALGVCILEKMQSWCWRLT